jgi:hypothetical protein
VRSALADRPILGPRAGRRLSRGAATLCAGLLGAVLVAGCDGDEPYVAPTQAPSADHLQPAAAAETLDLLERALRRDDTGAAAGLGADDASSALLGAIADSVTAAGLDAITFRYITENGQVTTDGTWTATVSATWRVGGFEQRSAHADVAFSFADDGTRIAAIGGGADITPVWLAGATTVRRTDDVVVIAAAGALPVRPLVAQAEEALTNARGVIDGTADRLVVEVPASTDGLDAALGLDPGSFDAIAAITTGADGSTVPGRPVHVFLNPEVYRGLKRLPAQVVMSHEAVHALTDAPASGAEPWLVEGFADYVALRDVDLPITRTAGQIIQQVRKAGVPAALPSRADLDSQAPHLGAAYEAAWLVCVTLADHGGQEALVRFYDTVLGGADLARALHRTFGWTVRDLTLAWQDELTDAAAADG